MGTLRIALAPRIPAVGSAHRAGRSTDPQASSRAWYLAGTQGMLHRSSSSSFFSLSIHQIVCCCGQSLKACQETVAKHEAYWAYPSAEKINSLLVGETSSCIRSGGWVSQSLSFLVFIFLHQHTCTEASLCAYSCHSLSGYWVQVRREGGREWRILL